MQTRIATALEDDNEAIRSAQIIQKCVHCGFCNATCPTFRHFGDELQGPRGRIYLVKGLLETNEVNSTLEDSLSKCLTCRACESTCPSGVEFGELAEFARNAMSKGHRKPSMLERLLLYVIPKPGLFRSLYRLVRLFRFFAPVRYRETLFRRLAKRADLFTQQGRVVILQGCVQRSLTPEVVQHLTDLLTKLGIKHRILEAEKCCGALHLHLGHTEPAKVFMRANIRAIAPREGEAIISTASGCGATLKDYGRILSEDDAAKRFSAAVQDVSEFLREFKFTKRLDYQRIAFQSPCTLQHGQKISGLIENLLLRAGYELCSIPDAHQCCGSAGSYSLLQPDIARSLRERKIEALLHDDPELIATANVGCQLHLEAAMNKPVRHWVELLDVSKEESAS
ncbi:MAG: glycolate oxidase subunit GlcF [Gammaproteobacteria bacterium]|nr:glycolate oxidase subunit GlcF [Gammaproteobacteria bacterium]